MCRIEQEEVFGTGKWQKVLRNINKSTKKLGVLLDEGKITLNEVTRIFHILKDISSLPEPVKENTRTHNSHILIGTRDEFFRHLKYENFGDWWKIYKVVFNFFIAKYDTDRFYQDCLNWFFGEIFRRGWILPHDNRPHDGHWLTIPPEVRDRLVSSIAQHCENMQRKGQPIERFIENILEEIEVEVELWR